MKHVFRLTLVVFFSLVLLSANATACPNCKAANETDSNLPAAYMYSILFMIGMPATLFAGFGISFYRMAAKEQQLIEANVASSPE